MCLEFKGHCVFAYDTQRKRESMIKWLGQNADYWNVSIKGIRPFAATFYSYKLNYIYCIHFIKVSSILYLIH